MRTLYDEDGNEVKVYSVVEEESSAGATYEYAPKQQDTSQHYEYPKEDREWHSWADVTEWNEKQKGNADRGEDYQEEKDEGRWTSPSGKGKGQPPW